MLAGQREKRGGREWLTLDSVGFPVATVGNDGRLGEELLLVLSAKAVVEHDIDLGDDKDNSRAVAVVVAEVGPAEQVALFPVAVEVVLLVDNQDLGDLLLDDALSVPILLDEDVVGIHLEEGVLVPEVIEAIDQVEAVEVKVVVAELVEVVVVAELVEVVVAAELVEAIVEIVVAVAEHIVPLGYVGAPAVVGRELFGGPRSDDGLGGCRGWSVPARTCCTGWDLPAALARARVAHALKNMLSMEQRGAAQLIAMRD